MTHDISPLMCLHPETHIATGVTVGMVQSAVAALTAELAAARAELAAVKAKLGSAVAALEGYRP